MPISERARRALISLGLTEYEIKAYISLIENGEQTAAEVSRTSGVPHSKIYEVLSNMEKKGWIEADHSRPSRFYPKAPTTCIDATKIRLEREIAENERIVVEELTPIYEKRGIKERPEIWIIRGEHNIIGKIKETIAACKKDLMITIPSISARVSILIAPSLTKLGQDVKVRVLLSSSVDLGKVLPLTRMAEVRLRDQMFGGGVIADTAQVVIVLGAQGENDSELAIWADHPGLARFARNYFEYLWADSTPLKR